MAVEPKLGLVFPFSVLCPFVTPAHAILEVGVLVSILLLLGQQWAIARPMGGGTSTLPTMLLEDQSFSSTETGVMIDRFTLWAKEEITGRWAVRAVAVDGSHCAIGPSGAHLRRDLVNFCVESLLDGAEFAGDVGESANVVAAGSTTAVARLLLALEPCLECLILVLATSVFCLQG